MKIKLAILEADQIYLDRIVGMFSSKYADKLEIYSFTSIDLLGDNIKKNKIDVLAASEAFEIDQNFLPNRCGFVYLVATPGVSAYHGQPAIFKYQKAERIYRRILSVFSEKVADESGYKFGSETSGNVITFVSASGGTGCSALAAACARKFAQSDKKTLYINLEPLSSTEIFFPGDGQPDFGTVISAVKDEKPNLALKLESEMRQDASKVYFYPAPSDSRGMLKLTASEMAGLMGALKASFCNFIVVDAAFSLDETALELYKNSAQIVFVSDGSQISNMKLLKAYNALEEIEEERNLLLMAKVAMIYNKFSNKTSKTITGKDVREFGGAPNFRYATPKQIVDQLAGMDIFDQLAAIFEPKN